ncbi:MAG TPA: hypothetical protein VFO67_03735 [Gemmatimonadales bacterium]|nr:hypothetical protein [Gemmatimonadales bacterium]
MNSTSSVGRFPKLNLRAGEWVSVRPADEILTTLDARQSLDGLPFMPEMLKYCGRRYRVLKVAHKTCDTVAHYSIRRLKDTVHLEGLRCDGAGHAGCQAACLIFWKEAWLERVPAASPARPSTDVGSHESHWATLLSGTRVPPESVQPERFRCQATDLHAFTTPVRRRGRWDPRLYIEDLTSGNVGLGDLVRYGALAMFNAFCGLWFGRRYSDVHGTAAGRTPTAHLQLQPGDLVRVRSKQEIMQTLGADNRNRGLVFDVEMLPHCGKGVYRVLSRVERIVDEKTGRLLTMSNPCLILDGVTCSGYRSSSRMFCPRQLYPYWREIWLTRVEEP